jgi:CMP-N-acetylneuraminic acid synthetase
VINTDSRAIAEAAQQQFSKVIIHWRPETIRGDMVSMNLIIADDMSRCRSGHFLQTHATNPLLSLQTVNRALDTYFSGLDRYDSLFSVTRLQTRLYWESGEPVNHDPAVLLRTQDLPPVFEENSLLYIFNRDSFASSGGNRIGGVPQMFVTPPSESVDIDDEHDFILAETLLSRRNQAVPISTQP